MILNRRALLAAIGLSLPAIAVAEAADVKKKTTKKTKPLAHAPKVAAHKPRRTKPAPAAQS